ncbi:MAG TPA: toll/interleukin-1 receptor domain-containing protein, partial [Opitutaceae bacterium]
IEFAVSSEPGKAVFLSYASPAFAEATADKALSVSTMNAELKAVFLSYASQDAEARKRICDALRQAGVEVWFDRSEPHDQLEALRHLVERAARRFCGPAEWDAVIRRHERAGTAGRESLAQHRFHELGSHPPLAARQHHRSGFFLGRFARVHR